MNDNEAIKCTAISGNNIQFKATSYLLVAFLLLD